MRSMKILLPLTAVFAVTLPIYAEPPELTSERFGQLVANFHRDTPDWPTSEAVAAWTRGLRMTTWTYANSGTFNEIDTAEEAAARAAQIKSWGFNTVLYSGRHYRQSFRDPESLGQILRHMKIAAEACHAEGLKLIDHLDLTLWYVRAYPLLFEHSDWVQVDVRTGAALRWFCLSDPGFTQDAINYLVTMQRVTGIDGYMVDEVNFREESCGCEDCRGGFEKDTGYRLPEDNENDVLFNRDHPLWRLWLQWRFKSAAEFRRRIQAALEVVQPDLIWFTYSTNLTRPSAIETSGDVFQRARVVNFPGFEGTNVVYPGYAYLHAGLRTLAGFNRAHDRHGWAQYPCSNPSEYAFSAFLSAVDGQAPWFSSGAWDAAADIFADPAWPRLTHPREPVADVAVIFSTATRDRDSLAGYLHHDEYFGWCQTLLRAGIAFESVPDRAVDADMARFRAIIVPACRALPAELTDRLETFTRGGGTLIVSGSAGHWDGWGFDAREPLHQRLLGAESMALPPDVGVEKARIIGTQPRSATLTDGGVAQLARADRAIIIEQGAAWDLRLAGGNQRVLATFDDGGPAMTLTPLDNGRMVHFAFHPGREVYEDQLHRGRAFEGRANPSMSHLMNATLDRLADATDWTRVNGSGDGVLSAIYRDGNHAVVHLLNVAGVPKLEAGQRVEDKHALASYPPLGTIEVQLRGLRIATATLLEPDTDRTTSLSLQHVGDVARVAVPAESFTRYAAIELTLEP